MRKYLVLLILLLSALATRAQLYKMFVDGEGKHVDSAKALSYIVWHQVSDTSWLMQQYDMHNTILQAGNFKDKALKIPHGKFVYYNKLTTYNIKLPPGVDTSNFLRTFGEYKNGQKNGWWLHYMPNGHKNMAEYYQNGILDGPYEAYNTETNTVFTSGNYVNNQREGPWYMLNPKGDTIEKDMYDHGKIVEHHESMKPFIGAKPPAGLVEMIVDNASRLISESDHFNLLIGFDISPEGKLINAQIISHGYSQRIDRQLLDIISKSSSWIPANTGDPKHPVKDFSSINIVAANGRIEVRLINNDKVKERFYNIMH